jgi:glycosyltransferase involved in cell wall biosynthesis
MHVASAWADRHGVPRLVTSESHPRRHGAVRSRARRLVAGRVVRGAAAWLPVSSKAQELLVSLGADPARCVVVPNAPDAERFAAARRDDAARRATRAALGAAPHEPVTVFVGRLVLAKGLSVLLDAARLLGAPAPTLWIAGGGPLGPKLSSRVEREGLSSVRLLGERGYEDVVRLLAAADVVVLPSVHEPYGVALHEGMAAGCAALASDAVGAASDLVEEGATGSVVPTGDARALATAWSALVSDRARLAAIGAAAQRRALERGLPFAVAGLERAVLEVGRPAAAGARP